MLDRFLISLALSLLLLLFLCLGLGLDDDNFRSSLRQCERKRIRKRIDNLVEVAATRAHRSEKRNYTMQKMGLFYRVADRVVAVWGGGDAVSYTEVRL